jgi:hypothetical protein
MRLNTKTEKSLGLKVINCIFLPKKLMINGIGLVQNAQIFKIEKKQLTFVIYEDIISA